VASEKGASNVRHTSDAVGRDVRFICSDGLCLGDVLPTAHFDCVFMSNYLEHLPSCELVIKQLAVVRRLLKPGGRAIGLQPNIRLSGAAYWDFIDHKVALTERSLDEAARVAGLERRACITRSLPDTTKSRLPKANTLVHAYLAVPPAWWLLGKQTLFVSERPEVGHGA
jgi:SAM-dependent methyltransferase